MTPLARSMRVFGIAATLCVLAAGGPLRASLFEQVVEGPRGAWRTRAAGLETILLTDGFIVRRGDTVRRFRWDDSMQLESLAAEQPLPSNSYVLSGPDANARLLPHARQVRASSRDRQVSVLYYFGPRGFEFDIELAADTPDAVLRLESIDGDVVLDSDGRALVDGEVFALRPVAYNLAADGVRLPVSAAYRLEDTRHLLFAIGPHDPGQRLVVDPVLTYSSYFAGSGEEAPLAIRELEDGSVLLAGNTSSLDLPQGVSLNGILTRPSTLESRAQCFIARMSPSTGQIHSVSYLGNAGFTSCSAMELDGSGRILLAGIADGASTLTTANAQYRTARYQTEAFLARIAANGKTLEYSSYLRLDCITPIHMQPGPGETVYLGMTCSGMVPDIPGGYQQTPGDILLLRYDIAARQFDRKSYFGDEARFRGIALAPGGGLYVFGSTGSTRFPLLNPLQSAPPAGGLAGFVGALSGDLRTLLYGSYLGGQQLHAQIDFLLPAADGSIWMTGWAYKGSIPGLDPLEPEADGELLFAMQIRPGNSTPLKAILSGRVSSKPRAALLLPNNRFCLLTLGSPRLALPGGAALGAAAGASVPVLGCLNAAGNNFDLLSPVGTLAFDSFVAAPSRQGGVWAAHAHPYGGFGDVVPFEFKAAALQPYRPNVHPETSDIVLQHVDLTTPNPALQYPLPLRLTALQGNFVATEILRGARFSLGMLLDVDGEQAPLEVTGPSTATLNYQSPSVEASFGEVLNLRAGSYTGRLLVPIAPEPAVSEPFPVIVENMAPSVEPFVRTTNPRVFQVSQPVYRDSQVLWNGQPLAIRPAQFGNGVEVEIPAPLAQPGTAELVLINRPPWGGVQRAQVTFSEGSSGVVTPNNPAFRRLRAEFFQVDRSQQILYTIYSEFDGSREWNLTAYTVPGGEVIRTAVIPKGDAQTVVSMQLSSDRRFLYMLDDLLRVMRFRADSFTKDLQFQVTPDAPRNSDTDRLSALLLLDDAPESFVVATPGGRMILYDRDRQRPYTTTDFPSLGVGVMAPVLANSRVVYAMQHGEARVDSPCVVRYPIDGLGFATPDDLCDLSVEWGRHPEMKTHAGKWVLQDGDSTVGLLRQPDFLGMRDFWEYDPVRNLAIIPYVVSFDSGTRQGRYRLVFRQRDSGNLLGHFPRVGASGGYGSSIALVGDTMLYRETNPPDPPRVVIVPAWQTHSEWYP